MPRRVLQFAFVAVAVLVGVLFAGSMHAAAAATPAITLDSPTEGQSLLSNNVQISGTAPSGVLVAITIADTDTNEPLVEHQPSGKILGSVTSDSTGHWVYTPQQTVVPGDFSVKATYTTSDNQVVTSPTVQFVVTTAQGSSHIFSKTTTQLIMVGAGVVVLFLLWLLIHSVRRRRKKRRMAEAHEEFSHKESEEAQGPAPLDERPASAGTESKAEADQEGVPEESSGQPAEPSEHHHEPGTPLFMGTAEGRQYRERQDAKLEAFEEETFRIEDELAKTAEELERANAQVIALRQRLASKKGGDDEPPLKTSKHKK